MDKPPGGQSAWEQDALVLKARLHSPGSRLGGGRWGRGLQLPRASEPSEAEGAALLRTRPPFPGLAALPSALSLTLQHIPVRIREIPLGTEARSVLVAGDQRPLWGTWPCVHQVLCPWTLGSSARLHFPSSCAEP